MYDDAYDDASIVSDFRERYAAGGPPTQGAAVRRFRSIIYAYFRKHARDFPWRRTDDPYRILVSEIMLQQTQTGRVTEKYLEFIRAFPAVQDLARAPLRDVLAVWQGMGYNRRARYLHELAIRIVEAHDGVIPDSPGELVALPGIGRATAASICAFAFNRPVVFIETNIRAVFIHFFLHDREGVSDDDILPLAAATLDRNHPHRWYSALMDYGAMLKKRHPNPSRKSAHHAKQKPFAGSRRELRGEALRTVLAQPGITVRRLATAVRRPEDEVVSVVDDMVREGLVRKQGKRLFV
ncbi:MAG: A/G-specific adenine glycosylase [Spirochaetes bacterium]|nr:A/G-specific adenine glycosylase [Spirochaetota bacterium]